MDHAYCPRKYQQWRTLHKDEPNILRSIPWTLAPDQNKTNSVGKKTLLQKAFHNCWNHKKSSN